MSDRLRDLRPDLRVDAVLRRIVAASDLAVIGTTDFVVQAADDLTIPLDQWLAAWADEHLAGFTMASVGIDVGYWGPTALPGRSSSAGIMLNMLETLRGNARRQITPWSLGATNSAVAALAARDIVALLAGAPEAPSLGQRVRIRFKDGDIRALALHRGGGLA
jgi:hypothetical protein